MWRTGPYLSCLTYTFTSFMTMSQRRRLLRVETGRRCACQSYVPDRSLAGHYTPTWMQVAFQMWGMPAVEFDGMWESLVFEDNLKTKLLRYVATAMRFSEQRVDPKAMLPFE